ncbi:MAG: flagellar basal-body rod protein FlgG [Hydrogenophilales bacterium]|nr:flagellar basal-body rod protein FlgG [Hydrogenophilales bacterium]
MIRSLWISKTGLEAQQLSMDVIANNLANVSTNGFKRSRAVFEDLLYQTLRQPGAKSTQQTEIPSGLQLGTGVHPVATERIHTQGNLQQTGNALDVAVNGTGFFQILQADGTTAYSRDGSFQLNSQGQIVTASGYVVQPAITIPSNAISISISRDGIVSALTSSSTTPTQIGQLQLASFINTGGLQSQGENLYIETASSGSPSTGNPGSNGLGFLNQGYVETSNVNVAEELVNMIQTQRAFEINSRAITASDQMLQKLATL